MGLIRRRTAVGALAVIAVALAACSDSTTPSASPPPPASAPSAPETSAAGTAGSGTSGSGTSGSGTSGSGAAGSGVTTDADVFGPGCSSLPHGDTPGSLDAMRALPVAAALGTNPELATLAAAVKSVPGLPDALDNTRGLTVFAPVNSAFDAASKPPFASLRNDPNKLDDLLSYHLIGRRYDAKDLVAAGQTTQLAGGTLTIGGTAAAPTITDGQGNTAKVLCGNIPTANATVFFIDRVLQPKS